MLDSKTLSDLAHHESGSLMFKIVHVNSLSNLCTVGLIKEDILLLNSSKELTLILRSGNL